ncbi:PREDICTED: zinc finger CCCH domain-containing protein 44-like isoform X2 [Tarenaya hassleriana]|uniref:zinc finger CCCH domain-containing protein 44-like isoform X1 n=1 Tax=Tarenaya hassleriana TaxID=28532 RepID=UPI00053C34E8|nr:PREDICTED: zinc finger CCCH domain-containing protein 44-like isoform X1 [Tarenaya hassleriana]XP_019056731.1 PREDICTED: zinc finger CCCH domain-containing protein 44-like isoform X2 [Tarenaya hassleriana]
MDNHQQQLRQGEPEQPALPRRDPTSVKGIDLMRVDQCEEIGDTGVPSLAGAPPTVAVVGGLVDVSVEQEPRVVDGVASVKRRRGRPPKGQAKMPPQPRPPPPPPPRRMEDEEEDICFICFDGGDLVLCDRRNCPKAYHPACIKRDEAFFQTKAKWNCGWHICSTCQKASSYMCYTCTYSVCKRCMRDADCVSVRGNMGLCAICMKIIMLIENVAQGENETVKVDFDDKTSWEYLFKVYWLCLKQKLSLTLDELTKATNPCKEVSCVAPKRELQNELRDHSYNRAYSSDHNCVDVAVNGTKRRRTSDPPNLLNKMNARDQDKLPGGSNWATKELLEFVAYMKNGDTSVLSQFDVQGLLLDYIKSKNLRDPRQKSHVRCDLMLVRLFGKQRVGHFEMLKLLESHFLIQENSSNAKTMNGEATHVVPLTMAKDSVQETMGIDRRRKTCKKVDDGVRNANKDEYAAIDVHNIHLIYLRRKFLEILLDDISKVHEKVVGTIVRIRVSGSDQKLDIHRLVQVVGTSKVTESYQIGKRTTDVMLGILNLDKREVISIDQLSNQDVTEDECKRLRQSIKCGLNKQLTVGEILEKAATLQTMRANEALEAEILKLNYLRDRASENGHRKELRECVEKLELLKSPEEYQRRMLEIPEVHTDPSMNPCHASAEDSELGTRKQDNQLKTKSKSPQNKGDILSNLGNNAQEKLAAADLPSRNVCTAFYTDRDSSSKVHNSSDIQETFQKEENEIWRYQDPTGKIQGPFSMAQLRRWKSSGHFPPYLRIWRTHEKQDDSVLLTDALAGRFNKASFLSSAPLPSEELKLAFDLGKSAGLDVNASSDKGDNNLLKNSAANNTSTNSCSPSHVVHAAVNNQNETQAEGIIVSGIGKLASGNALQHLPPQASCSQSSSVILENTVAHEVREIPGSDLSNAVQTNGNHGPVKNTKDSMHAGSVYLQGSGHAPNLNQEIHFLDFPSPTPKSSPEDLETQAAETIQSLSSCVLVKGPSGVTWAPSSVVVDGAHQLPQIPQQNNDVMTAPAENPVENIVVTQNSDNTQVAHSSGWPAIVADPDECDESVSDLLAEVEAMEQNGLPSSPTSTFHCDDDDLTKGPEKDFFHPVARMSLADQIDTQNVAGERSSPASDLKESSKTMDELPQVIGPELPLFAPPPPPPPSASIGHDLNLKTTALRLGSEATAEADTVEKSGNGSGRGNTERSPWGEGQQQQRYGGGERERSTMGHRERQWWNNGSSATSHSHTNNRQWPYSSRHGHSQSASYAAARPPKGLRICKFYESGYCKKGASCSFWHP